MAGGWFTATVEGDALDRLDQLSGGIDTMLNSLVLNSSRALLPHLKERAPVAHGLTWSGSPIQGGALRESLQWAMGPLGATLLGRQYGEFVIGGTAPHTIRPRFKKALAFWKDGPVITMRVEHPGTQPNDFRQLGVQQAFDTMSIQDVILRVVGSWIGGTQA